MSASPEERTGPGTSAWSRWGPWALLLCAWVLKTWEIWRHLSQRHYALWGSFFDTLQMLWMSWWTNFSLHDPEQSLFFTSYLNHPNGAATEMKTGLAWVHSAMAGILQNFVGPTTSHNLVALLGCAVTLVGMFLLLRHLSRNGWLAAVLAALVFTFGLGFGRTLPDLEVICFGYAALAMLAWIRYLEDGGTWRLALAVALVAWTCYTQMYYGLSLLAMLGVAAAVSLAGLSPLDAPASRIWRRTLLVLGLGLGLATLSHLQSIAVVFEGGHIPEAKTDLDMAPPTRFPISVWRAVGMLVFLGTTMWIGIRARVAAANFWGLLIVPIAVISLGGHLIVTEEFTLPMPFVWLKMLSPVFQRLNWTFRFVAPVLLGMAAMYSLWWRNRSQVMGRLPGAWSERWFAVALVLVFWIGAAFGPVVPRIERIPLLDELPAAKACAEEYPDSCTMTQQWISLCTAEAGAGVYTDPDPTFVWALGHFLEPFLPVGTVPIPGPPPCIEHLMAAKDNDALLEFSAIGDNGYLALFQTLHQRPLAGFPMFGERYRGLVDSTPLTFLPVDFKHDRLTAADLPEREVLTANGVGWVSLYRGGLRPFCGFRVAVEGFTAPWLPDEDDFAELYGPPVCRDSVLTLYRTMSAEDGK